VSRLVVAVWFASTLTLFAQQWREARAPHRFGPEIADESRALAQTVLDGCRSRIGGDDVLGIAFSRTESVHQYLTFRLAYTLYPTKVMGVDYREDDVEPAVAQVLSQHPTYLLILGGRGVIPRGTTLEARLAPEATLFRVGPRPR
jgi:hypothetical protein